MSAWIFIFSLSLPFGFGCTVRTNAFQYIVDAVQCKSLRQLHHRSGNVGEAEGFVAFLAMEMGVQVAYVARATVTAHGILEGTRPVIYTVYQMMGEE